MSAPTTYAGFMYGPIGQRIYPSPLDSPGKYRPRQFISREIKKSISQFDHSELLSLSTQLCSRIPALRSAIRDKNAWAFAHWPALYTGENEKWGEQVEEWLHHEVFPNACFNELRPDYAWGMRISGMGMDIHADDLAIFTEDEFHNPRIMFIPAPRIGNGPGGGGFYSTVMNLTSGITIRPDGQSETIDGQFAGLPIYNGIIRRNGKPIAARVLGTDEKGKPTFTDLQLGFNYGTHYANEYEWFGQGRPVPRIAASVLQWMQIEEIDDNLLKALKLASTKMVTHKLPPGQDAAMARGNAIEMSALSAQQFDASGNLVVDSSGNAVLADQEVYVEYLPDGNVMYLGSDEELAGLDYGNPSSDVEAFAMRVTRGCLKDLGWSYELLDLSSTGRAPTRLTTEMANLSITDRQSVQRVRTIQFIRYAVAKGMENKQIPRNDANMGLDAMQWGIGFPAQISVDQGNDVTAAIQMLKVGLTNERIEDAKSGHVAKHILRQREKEINAKMAAANRTVEFVKSLGQELPFEKAVELYYQPNPNSTAQPVKDESQNTEPAKTPSKK